MARGRKKHTAKKRHHSRKRVSGIKGDFMTELGGSLVGFIGGRMLGDKLLPNVDDKIKAVGLAALGIYVVPMAVKGSFGKGISMGMAVAGGEKLLQSTGLIAGIGMSKVAYLPYSKVAGAGISETVSGTGISETVGSVSRRRSRAEA